jgi:1,4-alpha-glucan branching enzyme
VTAELPVVSGESEPVPAGELTETGEAVPESPAPGSDSVLDGGPAAPVSGDAPAEPPPTPADRASRSFGAPQSDDTDASAGSGAGRSADRTDDDTSTAQ